MDLHLTIDRVSGGLSAQIAAELRAAIRSGALAALVRLPASRDLAADLGLSRGVVVEAYEQLVAEGFLTSRVGAGTIVSPAAGPAADPITDARQSDDFEIDLRQSAPDLSLFPRTAWIGALRAALAAIPDRGLGYPDVAGAPVLRAELAGYLNRVRATVARPDRVIVTSGVAQALHLAIRAARRLGYGDRLGIEDPAGLPHRSLLVGAGATLVPVPVDDQGVDVDALDRSGVRVVLLTPTHQYPTGVALSPRRRTALIEWAKSADALIIEDDYDAEFRYDREPVGALQGLAPDRVVLAGSVSKALAPGLRLGWLLGPAALAGTVAELRELIDLGSPTVEQYALARLIASGGYDRHLRRVRRAYRARRDALTDALTTYLPGLRLHGIAAGLHAYAQLGPEADDQVVAAAAAAVGVGVLPVTPMRWAPGPPALVLGFARHSPERLQEVARRLATVTVPGRLSIGDGYQVSF
jgi:GntR family transcriptional regulator / MocR family aminotransferase